MSEPTPEQIEATAASYSDQIAGTTHHVVRQMIETNTAVTLAQMTTEEGVPVTIVVAIGAPAQGFVESFMEAGEEWSQSEDKAEAETVMAAPGVVADG